MVDSIISKLKGICLDTWLLILIAVAVILVLSAFCFAAMLDRYEQRSDKFVSAEHPEDIL
jgi:hypothetical protein